MKDKQSNLKNGINLDYDYNTEYGDGDIPDCDKNISEMDLKNNDKNKYKNKSGSN